VVIGIILATIIIAYSAFIKLRFDLDLLINHNQVFDAKHFLLVRVATQFSSLLK